MPASLEQAFELVVVIFGSYPARWAADIAVKLRRRERDGLLQRFPRFHGLAELAERCGEGAVITPTVRKSADRARFAASTAAAYSRQK